MLSEQSDQREQRRKRLGALFRFVANRAEAGEVRWLRGMCQGNEEILRELLNHPDLQGQLGNLSLEEVIVAAEVCQPMLSHSDNPTTLEWGIDSWYAALPLARKRLGVLNDDKIKDKCTVKGVCG